ncbi:MAG: histidine phosphatase family protein [Spirochaetales bacterium]|nr:histidine phosphatase family protein [Spirochaetales bacterium]
MTRFYLIRHGEPDWNLTLEKNLHPCRHDFVPLTARGITQAEEICSRYTFPEADIIVASPYTRALQTAAILAKKLSLPLSVEYDLHERLPDTTFAVNTREELFRLCGQWEASAGTRDETSGPWESLDLIRKRILIVFRRYLSHRGVIVVFHELAMRSLLGIDERISYCEVRMLPDEDLFSQERL